MIRLFILFFFTVFSMGLVAQEDSLVIHTVSTKNSGDFAWTHWEIETSIGTIHLVPKGRAGEWNSWEFYGDGMESLLVETDVFDEWQSWQGKGVEHKYTMNAQGATGEEWKAWHIEDVDDAIYTLDTRYSGDDAWNGWELRGEGELMMEIDTRFSGGNAWHFWTVKDYVPFADKEVKLNALFLSLMSAMLPHIAPKLQCKFKGNKLYGLVRFVDQNPDVKIKYVEYGADLRVRFVNSESANCGEWKEVHYGADVLRVQVVEFNEDIKVQKVSYDPGLRK